MALVEQPEARAHLAQLELRPERQRQERQVGLGEAHVARARSVLELLTHLPPHLAPRVRIDLAEQPDFDLAGEESVFLPC
jgi:hypothetical protein